MIISNVKPGLNEIFQVMSEKEKDDEVKRGLTEAFIRAKTLLRATYDILKKCDESPYVLNVLEQTATWDGAECDGNCLMDDIRYWFDEFVAEELPE